MAVEKVTLEKVVSLAKQLTPVEKVQLIEKVAPDLEAALEALSIRQRPLRSSYGICSDLGPRPSAEDIEEVRREILQDFPREDI